MNAFKTADQEVLIWWTILCGIALFNIIFWLWRVRHIKNQSEVSLSLLARWQMILSGSYVFGCAFRSFWPRVDAQRLCLFDVTISSIFIGRSVATVAEICFVAQWAIVLWQLGRDLNKKSVMVLSYCLIPLIFIAEIFSWAGVLTTNFLFHAIEESLWTLTVALVGAVLILSRPFFVKKYQRSIDGFFVLALGYIAFMCLVDVPMYLSRAIEDHAQGKMFLTLEQGFWDSLQRRVVTGELSVWLPEMPWMTLYFSLAVWLSLFLMEPTDFKKHVRRNPF